MIMFFLQINFCDYFSLSIYFPAEMGRQLMLKIGKLQFDVEEYKTIVGNIIVDYTTKICLKANMIVGFYFLPTSSILDMSKNFLYLLF